MRTLRPKEVKEFVLDPKARNKKNQYSLTPEPRLLITML